MDPGNRSVNRFRGGLVLLSLLALAATLRLCNLAVRPLWLDEAYSALYARLDLATFLDLRAQSTNPPLYHLLLGWWVDVWGAGEAALRLPSVLCGTACVGSTYLLGRALGGPRVGLLAGGLLAINCLAVGFSQEARYYALVELLAVAASATLRQVLRSRRRRWTAVYAVLLSLLTWTHVYAWLLLGGHMLAVAAGARVQQRAGQDWRPGVRRFGLALLFVLLAFLPWASHQAAQVGGVLADYWIPRPGLLELGAVVHGAFVPLAELRWMLAAATGGALLWTWRRARWARHLQPGISAPAAASPQDNACLYSMDTYLLLGWALVPVVLPWVWSLAARPIFYFKYTLLAQPALILLWARLTFRRPGIGWGFLLLLTAAHAPWPHRGLQFDDWRSAAQLLADQVSPAVPIYICEDYNYFALDYYLDTQRFPVTPIVRAGAKVSEFAELFPQPARDYAQWLSGLESGPAEAWIVASRLRQQPTNGLVRLLTDLGARGTVQLHEFAGDVEVIHWVRSPP